MMPQLDVREMGKKDIPFIIDYWMNSDPDFLVSIGVDLAKLPFRKELEAQLQQQLVQDFAAKTSYCQIWLIDGRPSGHCNINKISYGKEAFMHLHLWNRLDRKNGLGGPLVLKSLTAFFRNFQLETLYSEPYAMNTPPNALLRKIGFRFVKRYVTVPGSINFEQEVNLWELSREDFMARQGFEPP